MLHAYQDIKFLSIKNYLRSDFICTCSLAVLQILSKISCQKFQKFGKKISNLNLSTKKRIFSNKLDLGKYSDLTVS